jgi:hypothetical protein
MIWSERYFTNGDFEMVTPKIEATRSILPEGSFISLLDTREVMRVETHAIKVNKEGIPELNLNGRTLETNLENRAAQATVYREPWSAMKNYTTAEILAYYLWTYLVEAAGQDPSRVTGTHNAFDAIANLKVTDSSTLVEAVKEWSLQEGEVYAQLKDILALGQLGIRGIRPPGTTGNVVTFDTSGGGTRGDISRTSTPDISGLRLDVYNGLDRTRFQSDRESVIFHYDAGHIVEPSYLFSIKDWKTSALVSSSIGPLEVWPETGTTPPGTPPTGLDRRVLYVDGGTQGDADLGEFTASVIQKGMVELAKHLRSILFDGAISPDSPYIYGNHYTLGDKVSLIAQYGFEAEMLVAEYVRTQDTDGDRGYPTLILAT